MSTMTEDTLFPFDLPADRLLGLLNVHGFQLNDAPEGGAHRKGRAGKARRGPPHTWPGPGAADSGGLDPRRPAAQRARPVGGPAPAAAALLQRRQVEQARRAPTLLAALDRGRAGEALGPVGDRLGRRAVGDAALVGEAAGDGFREPEDGSPDLSWHLSAVQASDHDTLPQGAVVRR